MSPPGDPGAGAAGRPDASGLAAALQMLGLRMRVEPEGTLAVLVPAADDAVDWASRRGQVVRIARDHGFSHVALEVRDGGEPSRTPRDRERG